MYIYTFVLWVKINIFASEEMIVDFLVNSL